VSSQLQLDTRSAAVFSPCRTWRYSLTRIWDESTPLAMFIGLNPSTADETVDDQTVRRCIRFAREWGYGGLVMTNMYALRSTDPGGLLTAADPIGPDNDTVLLNWAAAAGVIVAAWGTWGTKVKPYTQRPNTMPGLVWPKTLQCLGVTNSGQPRHPLYLRADTELEPWSPA
jgi:hypothetical protein